MDLFVIDTPLQLLNAIEARQYFGINSCHLFMPKWKFWPSTAFEKLLKEMEWKSINWFEMDIVKPSINFSVLGPKASGRINEYVWTWRQFLRRRNLEKTLKQYGRIDRLVFGSLINLEYMCHIINCLPANELIAVDDGTFTLDVAAYRREGVNVDTARASCELNSVKRFIREQYVEWYSQQPKSVKFFTAYDVSFGAEDHVIPNRYDWLRARTNVCKPNNNIYFLGQPLIEDGYLDESTYFAYLEKIILYLGGETVLYLPHKRESGRTVSMVESRLGLPIKRFNEPIEVALALGEALPNILASFHCSALESCAKIFGGTLKSMAFYLPPESLLCGQESVEGVYSYFRNKQNDFFHVLEV